MSTIISKKAQEFLKHKDKVESLYGCLIDNNQEASHTKKTGASETKHRESQRITKSHNSKQP